MIVLGPLAVGTRLQFTISFTIPADYTINMGAAVIKDTLPNELSPYINAAGETPITDDKNAVTINGIALDRNAAIPEFTISAAGQEVSITIPADVLAISGYPGKLLVATIDTVLNNSIPAVASLDLTNTASVSIGSYYKDSGNVSAAFTLVPLGDSNQTSYVLDPTSVDRADNKQIKIIIYFKASEFPKESADFNYYISEPLSNYLSPSTLTVLPKYGDNPGATGNGSQFSADISQLYISFSNSVVNMPETVPPTTDITGKYISITMFIRTRNLADTTPEEVSEIKSSYTVSIGGAQAVPISFTIGINS